MATINSKSTKTEILEAYNAVKNRLDAMEAMKDDPAKAVIKAEKERVEKSATDIIEAGVLAPEIVKGYTDLQTAIKEKEIALKELFGIEAQANSMVALINAHKEKEVDLKARYDAMKADLDAEIAEKKANMEAELEALRIQKSEILESIRKENKDLIEALRIERKREEEEYNYNLKRTRKQENDAWTDEKVAKEKVLADREIAVLARETAMTEKEEYIAELELKVSEIPTLVDTAKEEGMKKGKSDADKSHAFEKRNMEMKNEYEQKALTDRVKRLEEDLETERNAKKVLQDKLDAAYAQMKELASETVKSSGGVKILDRETSGK